MKENIERISKLIEQDNYSGAVEEMEEGIINSPEFLQYATKEDLYGYELLDKLNEKDIKQLLKNVANSKEGLTKVELVDFMKMDKDFLKVIIFLRILERANNKSNEK